MDVLELYLDTKDSNSSVTAKASEKAPKPAEDSFTADIDLLMEEFTSATDNASKKDALMALLALTGRRLPNK